MAAATHDTHSQYLTPHMILWPTGYSQPSPLTPIAVNLSPVSRYLALPRSKSLPRHDDTLTQRLTPPMILCTPQATARLPP
eukprot:855423-Rhodomonas_salina.2